MIGVKMGVDHVKNAQSQSLDPAFALRQLFQQHHPVRRAQSAGDQGVFFQQGEFRRD